jgi:hypothetical protein
MFCSYQWSFSLIVKVHQRFLEGPDGILGGGIKRVEINTTLVGLEGASMDVLVIAQVNLGKVVQSICHFFNGILNNLESRNMLQSVGFMQSVDVVGVVDLN